MCILKGLSRLVSFAPREQTLDVFTDFHWVELQLIKNESVAGEMLKLTLWKRQSYRRFGINCLQMDIIRVSVTIYFLQLNLLLVLGQSCYGERSRRGFVLLNTTFNSRITNSYPSCVDMCLHDPLCMSLNYWRDEKKCDLNNSTRETCRSCFVPEETSTYMGMGRFPGKAWFHVLLTVIMQAALVLFGNNTNVKL